MMILSVLKMSLAPTLRLMNHNQKALLLMNHLDACIYKERAIKAEPFMMPPSSLPSACSAPPSSALAPLRQAQRRKKEDGNGGGRFSSFASQGRRAEGPRRSAGFGRSVPRREVGDTLVRCLAAYCLLGAGAAAFLTSSSISTGMMHILFQMQQF